MTVLADSKSMPAATISRFLDVWGPFGLQILQFLPGRQPILDIRSFLSAPHKFPGFSPSMLRLQILQFRPGRCPPLSIPSFSSSRHNYLRVSHGSFHCNLQPGWGGTGVGSVEGVEPMPWIVYQVEFIFKTIHDLVVY